MDRNRRRQQWTRAAAERKAVADLENIRSRRRAFQRAQRRRAIVRDAVLALTIALILFGAWKAIALAFAS
jgi:hypothetical protein